MREALFKLAAVRSSLSRSALTADLLRNLAPIAAPFLILACAWRWELATVAVCWSALILPGVLAANLLIPVDHPLGHSASRFATVSVLALAPFGLLSWIGCLLHWTLNTVLLFYAVAYLVSVLLLVRWLLKGSTQGSKHHGEMFDTRAELGLFSGRGTALAAILGVALIGLGAAWSTLETSSTQPRTDPFAARALWWRGTLLAAAGGILAAAAILWDRRSKRIAPPPAADRKSRPQPIREPEAQTSKTAALLWIGALALTVYVMNASFALPQSDFRRDAWNSDDVTYVAEALDYSYGAPMGRYEPTLGTQMPMSPVNLSPLIAPLVAGLSRITGVECAALHHSVLCPLIVLLGVSAMAGALAVVFRRDRWLVPLGLIVMLLMVCKSWDYERSMVEFTVWRAMQSKSVHLWLIHPLQLATLILLAVHPGRLHLGLALAVAVVGHLVHPFSTILGGAWCATVLLFEVLRRLVRRPAVHTENAGASAGRGAAHRFLVLGSLTAAYGLLGGAYKLQGRLLLPEVLDPATWPSSGRDADDAEESRDLVREAGRLSLRQEPRILFGYDVLFNLGTVALPVVLAIGTRRREWLYVGVIGVVALAVCNVAPLGRLFSMALPVSILWRARWMLPALVCIAGLAAALYEALRAVGPRGRAGPGAISSFVAALVVCGALSAMLAKTESRLLKIGPPPAQLTKFSADMHGLVALLGGPEAAPFVWGTREVTRELPQLMPHIKLVLSREKIMLPARHPQFRAAVLGIREKFRRGAVSAADVQALLQLYPIDHIVLESPERGVDPAVALLREAGWHEGGQSGRFHVWRKEAVGQ